MTVANVSMYFGLGIIFYYIFREISLNKQGKDFPNFNPSSFKNLALYFGTIVYALDGITVVKMKILNDILKSYAFMFNSQLRKVSNAVFDPAKFFFNQIDCDCRQKYKLIDTLGMMRNVK